MTDEPKFKIEDLFDEGGTFCEGAFICAHFKDKKVVSLSGLPEYAAKHYEELTAERDELLNQIDSEKHHRETIEKRAEQFCAERDALAEKLDRAIAEAVQIVLDDVGYTFDQLGEKAQRKLRTRTER